MFELTVWESIGLELQQLSRSVIQRDRATGAGFSLALPHLNGPLCKINLLPTKQPQLRVPHTGVERDHYGGQKGSRSAVSADIE